MLAENAWLVLSLPVIISHICASGQELNTKPERDGEVSTSSCGQTIQNHSPYVVQGTQLHEAQA